MFFFPGLVNITGWEYIEWMKMPPMLADRLGVTVHCSPLQFKLRRLARQHAVPPDKLDEWLVDL